MKLTPQQRIAAYEWAAERISKGHPFICGQLYYWVRNNDYRTDMDTNSVKKLFPEIQMFDPKTDPVGFWFKDTDDLGLQRLEARLFILGSCILMAEEEIKKQGKK